MRLIILLLIIGLSIFVVQQSHLIETKKVMDSRLGVYIDQTNLNWKNLFDYLDNLKKDIQKSGNRKRHLRESF